MSRKNLTKLSEEEAIKKIAQYEKTEFRLHYIGVYCLMISVVGIILGLLLGIEAVAMISCVLFAVGSSCVFLKRRPRNKVEALVMDQLRDFYNAELEKTFGPCQHTKEMAIDKALIKELRPVEAYWDDCTEWRFYEGDYHETRFSVENVRLSEAVRDQDGTTWKTKFEGAVLRCKDVCDPALKVALCGPEMDRQSTPELRELIQKIESAVGGYKVTALALRGGRATLAISGYTFGKDVPSEGESVQDFDAIRSRFIRSLTAVCNVIDVLRDSCGKI